MSKLCGVNITRVDVQLQPPMGSDDEIENKRLMSIAEIQCSTMQLISHERH